MRLGNNGNTRFGKLWEHMRVFHDEYPWTIPSVDPILLSCCDHGEPIRCPQSGQNTLETHPHCLIGNLYIGLQNALETHPHCLIGNLYIGLQNAQQLNDEEWLNKKYMHDSQKRWIIYKYSTDRDNSYIYIYIYLKVFVFRSHIKFIKDLTR